MHVTLGHMIFGQLSIPPRQPPAGESIPVEWDICPTPVVLADGRTESLRMGTAAWGGQRWLVMAIGDWQQYLTSDEASQLGNLLGLAATAANCMREYGWCIQDGDVRALRHLVLAKTAELAGRTAQLASLAAQLDLLYQPAQALPECRPPAPGAILGGNLGRPSKPVLSACSIPPKLNAAERSVLGLCGQGYHKGETMAGGATVGEPLGAPNAPEGEDDQSKRPAGHFPIYDPSTPAACLTYPLAVIGPLPPDLLAAFNAAVYHTTLANGIRRLLAGPPAAQGDPALGLVAQWIEQLRSGWNENQAAVLAVVNELNAVRSGSASFGEVVEANAHLAALALSRRVRSEIWSAADPIGWARCLMDESARMDLAVLTGQFEVVRQRLQILTLPDGQSIVAEIQFEAAKAAEQRRMGSPSQDSQEDKSEPLPPARHSKDFRSVYWYGDDYTFSPAQAACVNVLWEAWENGTPELGQATILEHPEVEAESKRLVDLFKGHPAWGKMIVKGKTAGAFRLAGPPRNS